MNSRVQLRTQGICDIRAIGGHRWQESNKCGKTDQNWKQSRFPRVHGPRIDQQAGLVQSTTVPKRQRDRAQSPAQQSAADAKQRRFSQNDAEHMHPPGPQCTHDADFAAAI